MKILKEMAADLWNGCWVEKLLLIMLLGCVGFIGVGIVIMIDQLGVDHNERVVIVGQDYTPAHTIMVTVSSGKTTTVVPQYTPDDWDLIVRYRGGNYACDTSEFWYNKSLEGLLKPEADAVFTTGLLTRNEYCNGLQPITEK